MSFRSWRDCCHSTTVLWLFPEEYLLFVSPTERCLFAELVSDSVLTTSLSLLKAPRVTDHTIAQSELAVLTQTGSFVRSYGDVKLDDSLPKG